MSTTTSRESLAEYCEKHKLSDKLTKAVNECYGNQVEDCDSYLGAFFSKEGAGSLIEKIELTKIFGRDTNEHDRCRVRVKTSGRLEGDTDTEFFEGADGSNSFELTNGLKGVGVHDFTKVNEILKKLSVPKELSYATSIATLKTSSSLSGRMITDMVSSQRAQLLNSLEHDNHDPAVVQNPKMVLWCVAGTNRSKVNLTLGIIATVGHDESIAPSKSTKSISLLMSVYNLLDLPDFQPDRSGILTGNITSIDQILDAFKTAESQLPPLDGENLKFAYAVKGDAQEAFSLETLRYAYEEGGKTGTELVSMLEGKNIELAVDLLSIEDDKSMQHAVQKLYRGPGGDGFVPCDICVKISSKDDVDNVLSNHLATSAFIDPHCPETILDVITLSQAWQLKSRPLLSSDPLLSLGLGCGYFAASPLTETWNVVYENCRVLEQHNRIRPRHEKFDVMDVPGSPVAVPTPPEVGRRGSGRTKKK
eukprot:TRINITY_DN4954_c3_g1_i1.p1 TRINITY_DN4954_c3_g1~~TRINITY_DN4954_c3_g1_i1.p1  ORF type:complete len:477 (+),score=46.13 TRINITY_DN4954_c3_g1_i1:1157-2587(+)